MKALLQNLITQRVRALVLLGLGNVMISLIVDPLFALGIFLMILGTRDLFYGRN